MAETESTEQKKDGNDEEERAIVRDVATTRIAKDCVKKITDLFALMGNEELLKLSQSVVKIVLLSSLIGFLWLVLDDWN